MRLNKQLTEVKVGGDCDYLIPDACNKVLY